MNTEKFSTVVTDAFLGQKVAVICARYQYWGILSKVLDDCLVISQATSVEESGPTQSEAPRVIDYIGSDVIIKNDCIEIVYQPNWALAPLGAERK